MSVTVSINGTNFSIPQTGETSWGDSVSSWIQAVSAQTLQKNSATFTLTQELDFGALAGIKALSYKSRATNPSSSGIVRLGNQEAIGWRNQANNADLSLLVNQSDKLTFNSLELVDTSLSNLTGLITNTHISASAAIAYSKLNLSSSIVNADVSNSAAIAYSKLNLTSSIVDSDVSNSAAIAFSKMASVTASRVLQSSAGGVLEASSVTTTELGYLSGVSSGIQSQINSTNSTLSTHTGASSGVHGLTGSVVGTTDTQTLSNKTLTSPVISSISNSGTLTLPTLTDTLVGRATTDTLSNKTLAAPVVDDGADFIEEASLSSPSAGRRRLGLKTDGKLYLRDSSGNETVVGSGGATGINYIDNPDAETDTTGFATYQDAQGIAPVDGTGGSPNITWTRSTSSPLRGLASFLLTKGAADRQGEGASYDFTIDSADQAKVMQIGFDYAVASGTYATGDLAIYIVDVTNSTVIQPSAYQVENVGVNSTARLTFQTASNSTSYRLCFHVASTSASAYSLKFDNIQLGPQVVPLGAPVTDWVSYTPTMTWVSGATVGAHWRRVGDTLEVMGRVSVNGGVTAAELNITVPSGLAIDTAKLISTTRLDNLGEARLRDDDAAAVYDGFVRYASTTSVAILGQSTTGSSNSILNSTVPFTWANNDTVTFEFRVPIVGWSSSTVVSSSADTRVVTCRATRSATQTGLNPNNSAVKVTFNTANDDTVGGFDTVNSRYVVKVPGKYRLSGSVYTSGTNVLANTYYTVLYVNGAAVKNGPPITASASNPTGGSVDWIGQLAVGDYVELFLFGVGNNSVNTLSVFGGINSSLDVELVQGPSQIAMSEIIACRYTSDAAQSIANTGFHIVNFEDKTYDTHNAVTTGASWKFTAPAPGKYEVSVTINYSTQTYAVGNNADVTIYKNGSLYSFGPTWDAQAAVSMQASNSYTDDVELNAGEYMDIRVSNGRTAGATALAAGGVQVSIKRLGGM